MDDTRPLYTPLASSDPDFEPSVSQELQMDPESSIARRGIQAGGDDHGRDSLKTVYGTLSKMWIANIDASLVSTTDAYTYFSCIVEVLNEGLPRAAWSTIGRGDTTKDSPQDLIHRLSLIYTLITVQSGCGFLLSVIFLFAAPGFVGAFVPGEVRDVSVKYLRILAFDALASTVNAAVGLGTRALDQPDVPLVMSSIQTLIQIILELALVSTVRVRGFNPTIHTIATIRLVCSLSGALVGLVYFVFISRIARSKVHMSTLKWFSYPAFVELFKPGRWTFMESAIRNAIYLWQIRNVVSMGQTYATAWGVFNTIRWGLVMVPVQALEATSNAFVGHRWGVYQERISGLPSRNHASWLDIRYVTAPALKAVCIALLIEVPLCIGLSFNGAKYFARYLSNSDEVADVTAMMWRSIDFCYICYAVSTQLATILLATETRWYLYQSLMSNLFYALPWAIALTLIGDKITPDNSWTYHRWVL
ncbi:hypothetical protein CVT24_001351 [Panaeolus cyanescens]|uniref:Uncharacterized protein n=1 Tax=Panaeolus cyanescens TaxID=181874 RepID=A0A409WXH9_9AGAR|nr:hypothetical protein CVT24_001351 [Panaeolus cyanescens]